MSVVIRDIDKPRDCDYCHFQTDSYCHVLLSYINVEHGVDTRCPIIEINEYTMKNGHKVVVADTPQTDGYMTEEQAEDYRKMLDKAEHKVYGNIAGTPQTETHDLRTETHECVKQTDCGWK